MDSEEENKLFAKYPLHIRLLVKAAKEAIRDGRVIIQDGVLVVLPQDDDCGENSDRKQLDLPTELNVNHDQGQADLWRRRGPQ